MSAYRLALVVACTLLAATSSAIAQSYEDGARQICDGYFSRYWSPSSGNNWVYGSSELADVTIAVQPMGATNADSLNGTEWKGYVSYRGVAIREGGSPWRDYTDPVFQCSVSLINGQWHGNAFDNLGGRTESF